MNYSFVSMVHSSSIYEHVLTEMPEETLQSCFVGNYLDPDEDIVEVSNILIQSSGLKAFKIIRINVYKGA